MCTINFICEAFTIPATFALPEMDSVTIQDEQLDCDIDPEEGLYLDTKSGQYHIKRWYAEEDFSCTVPKQRIRYEGPWNGFASGYGWVIPINQILEIKTSDGFEFISGTKGTAEEQYLYHRARKGYVGGLSRHYTTAYTAQGKVLLQKLEEILKPAGQAIDQLENPTISFQEEEFVEMDPAPPTDDGGWDSI